MTNYRKTSRRRNRGRGRGRTQRGGQNPPWPVDSDRFIPAGGRGRKRTQRGGLRPIDMTTAAHNGRDIIPFGH